MAEVPIWWSHDRYLAEFLTQVLAAAAPMAAAPPAKSPGAPPGSATMGQEGMTGDRWAPPPAPITQWNEGAEDAVGKELQVEGTSAKSGSKVPPRISRTDVRPSKRSDVVPTDLHRDWEPTPKKDLALQKAISGPPKPSKAPAPSKAPPFKKPMAIKSGMPKRKECKAEGSAESPPKSQGCTPLLPLECQKGGVCKKEDEKEANKQTEKGRKVNDPKSRHAGNQQTVCTTNTPILPLQTGGGRGHTGDMKKKKTQQPVKTEGTGSQKSTGRKSLEKKPNETDKQRPRAKKTEKSEKAHIPFSSGSSSGSGSEKSKGRIEGGRTSIPKKDKGERPAKKRKVSSEEGTTSNPKHTGATCKRSHKASGEEQDLVAFVRTFARGSSDESSSANSSDTDSSSSGRDLPGNDNPEQCVADPVRSPGDVNQNSATENCPVEGLHTPTVEERVDLQNRQAQLAELINKLGKCREELAWRQDLKCSKNVRHQ